MAIITAPGNTRITIEALGSQDTKMSIMTAPGEDPLLLLLLLVLVDLEPGRVPLCFLDSAVDVI